MYAPRNIIFKYPVALMYHLFHKYISIYNTTYYCLLPFSQPVSVVHGHHQVSNSLKLLDYMVCPASHITRECDIS
jgi:hypothetical protein